LPSATANKVRPLPFELLLDQKTIEKRVTEMGREITHDYTGETPVLLGALKGCIIFIADLMRHIKLPIELEFISAASYRQGRKQEDVVLIGGALSIPLEGRHVLVVEGVVDSGKTIQEIIKMVKKQDPASVEIVTFIDKPANHRSKMSIKYKGFTLGNEFLIGYGLDNTQKYRNLPFIGKVVERN
jgi:hypoxanthine phosphoribosyltransferase